MKLKNKKNLSKALAVAAIGLTGVPSEAKSFDPPRGDDVLDIASGCPLGPFGQTNKAGPYNHICNEMSDAEKCLAYIKDNLNRESDGSYEITPVYKSERAKASFCINTFVNGLLVEGTSPEED